MEEIEFYFNNLMKNWDNIEKSKIKTQYSIYKYFFDSGKGSIGPGKKLEILLAFGYTHRVFQPVNFEIPTMLKPQQFFSTKDALMEYIKYNMEAPSKYTKKIMAGNITDYYKDLIIKECGYIWALIKP